MRPYDELTLPSVARELAERNKGHDVGGHTWAVTGGGARRSDAPLLAGPGALLHGALATDEALDKASEAAVTFRGTEYNYSKVPGAQWCGAEWCAVVWCGSLHFAVYTR